jgi:hypothetical protein
VPELTDPAADAVTLLVTLLAEYDSQLREESEVPSADDWTRDGPLVRAMYDGGYGFVSYRDLRGYDGPDDGARLDALIEATIEYYVARPELIEFEWKTRGHDLPADLPGRLLAHGFVAGDPESVMIGEAILLAADVPLPAGVTVRRIHEREDVVRAERMTNEVFGPDSRDQTDTLVRILENRADEVELWVAEADGEVVCAGRLEIVPGTSFAGIWGGSTAVPWRGQGIYRALTAARARSALAHGVTYLQSDSTEYSRPILERAGLVKVTTTTPYVWKAPSDRADVPSPGM